ncbi:RNA methyltransferase [Corticimicrobacter populi]|nr:RNA methyltransferase [Corticimicrobacter populi]
MSAVLPASLFDRVRFIMVEPSHPGNVGAAARAIKTMGFTKLTLVRPHLDDVLVHPDAIALSSGATDVLAGAEIVPDLAAGMRHVTLALALTARPRDLGPPNCDIRQAASLSVEHLTGRGSDEVAIVLGTERAGLTNEQIARCQRICQIPANPAYSSLNVAQALQLAAWELRYALNAESSFSTGGTVRPGDRLAGNEAVQALLTHWEEALIGIQFLDPAHPKKLMLRMRHLLTRSNLSQDEVDMLRGVCTAMLKTARLAHPPAP